MLLSYYRVNTLKGPPSSGHRLCGLGGTQCCFTEQQKALLGCGNSLRLGHTYTLSFNIMEVLFFLSKHYCRYSISVRGGHAIRRVTTSRNAETRIFWGKKNQSDRFAALSIQAVWLIIHVRVNILWLVSCYSGPFGWEKKRFGNIFVKNNILTVLCAAESKIRGSLNARVYILWSYIYFGTCSVTCCSFLSLRQTCLSNRNLKFTI